MRCGGFSGNWNSTTPVLIEPTPAFAPELRCQKPTIMWLPICAAGVVGPPVSVLQCTDSIGSTPIWRSAAIDIAVQANAEAQTIFFRFACMGCSSEIT